MFSAHNGYFLLIFQIQDECQLVKDCICGQIYDSSPIDFTSDLGTRLILHPTAVRVSEPRKLVSWMAKMVASGLDTLFLSRFEAQRAEYWQTLYSSAVKILFCIFTCHNFCCRHSS